MKEKEEFWTELGEVVDIVPKEKRAAIEEDFNGQVGEQNRGDEGVMGQYNVMERNVEGKMVVSFTNRMEMAVNKYFKKREEHKVTYKSGGRTIRKEDGDCMGGI